MKTRMYAAPAVKGLRDNGRIGLYNGRRWRDLYDPSYDA